MSSLINELWCALYWKCLQSLINFALLYMESIYFTFLIHFLNCFAANFVGLPATVIFYFLMWILQFLCQRGSTVCHICGFEFLWLMFIVCILDISKQSFPTLNFSYFEGICKEFKYRRNVFRYFWYVLIYSLFWNFLFSNLFNRFLNCNTGSNLVCP